MNNQDGFLPSAIAQDDLDNFLLSTPLCSRKGKKRLPNVAESPANLMHEILSANQNSSSVKIPVFHPLLDPNSLYSLSYDKTTDVPGGLRYSPVPAGSWTPVSYAAKFGTSESGSRPTAGGLTGSPMYENPELVAPFINTRYCTPSVEKLPHSYLEQLSDKLAQVVDGRGTPPNLPNKPKSSKPNTSDDLLDVPRELAALQKILDKAQAPSKENEAKSPEKESPQKLPPIEELMAGWRPMDLPTQDFREFLSLTLQERPYFFNYMALNDQDMAYHALDTRGFEYPSPFNSEWESLDENGPKLIKYFYDMDRRKVVRAIRRMVAQPYALNPPRLPNMAAINPYRMY